MSQEMPSPNADDQRDDLQAMLAASRELGPEMDSSLVDSYMSRHTSAKPRPQGGQGQPGQPGQSILPWGGHGLRYIGFGVLVAALILVAILSMFGAGGVHGFWFPWFFLPWLFFMLFARRGMYRSRRTYSYTDENGRQVWVRERARGYGPYGPGDQSPDQNGRYAPRGPYSAPNGGYGPSDRTGPDGQPLPPRPSAVGGSDAAAADDVQAKYGADSRTDQRADRRADYGSDQGSPYRPRYASDDRDPPAGT